MTGTQHGFIQKSATYSQTCKVKHDIVIPKLRKYNNVMLEKIQEVQFKPNDAPYKIFPNNNKKFFVFITHKSNVDQNTNDSHNIVYFFPDDVSKDYYKDNKLVNNVMTDFFIEINKRFESELLLEGYLYQHNGLYQFLCTDLLMINDRVLTVDHDTRWSLLHEYIYFNKFGSLEQLNHHISFELHPYVLSSSMCLLPIFSANFIHKDEIVCEEHVYDKSRERQIYCGTTMDNNEPQLCPKLVRRTKLTDVYDVYDANTKNNQGIMYIKGLKESRWMRDLFKQSTSETMPVQCWFDRQFNKWRPDCGFF
jgi:hypothetical protein